jgi:hypothetical protein
MRRIDRKILPRTIEARTIEKCAQQIFIGNDNQIESVTFQIRLKLRCGDPRIARAFHTFAKVAHDIEDGWAEGDDARWGIANEGR